MGHCPYNQCDGYDNQYQACHEITPGLLFLETEITLHTDAKIRKKTELNGFTDEKALYIKKNV